jgi:hypothetical protein
LEPPKFPARFTIENEGGMDILGQAPSKLGQEQVDTPINLIAGWARPAEFRRESGLALIVVSGREPGEFRRLPGQGIRYPVADLRS